MNCKYHGEREAVAKCKVCGADLCKECNEYQRFFDSCLECANLYATETYYTYKNNFIYNLLSIICAGVFLILYIVSLAFNKLNSTLIVVGAIALSLLLPVSILLLVFSAKKIKVYKKLTQSIITPITKLKK